MPSTTAAATETTDTVPEVGTDTVAETATAEMSTAESEQAGDSTDDESPTPPIGDRETDCETTGQIPNIPDISENESSNSANETIRMNLQNVSDVAPTVAVPNTEAAAATTVSRRSPLVWILATALVLVLGVCGFLGWKVWGAPNDNPTLVAQEEPRTEDLVDDKSAEDESSPQAQEEAKTEHQVCEAIPEAIARDVHANNDVLIVRMQLNASTCENQPFTKNNVGITIKDTDNNVIAAAVFDFAKRKIAYKDGTMTVDLAFDRWQYWRAPSDIEVNKLDSAVQYDQEGRGEAKDVDNAYGGRNIAELDAERYAQLALSWQLENDKSAATKFYYTYTTQLSSKRYGMEVEGQTWSYTDIYHHYLGYKAKHPQSLLIWGSDYPTYTKHGNDSSYYVILSGESFDSSDAATGWCGANGYTSDDCLAVDLQ